MRLFLTLAPEKQKARIAARNGEEMLARFVQEWIPMEETYFFAREIESSFNFRVSFVSMTVPLYVYNSIIYTYSQILIVTFF